MKKHFINSIVALSMAATLVGCTNNNNIENNSEKVVTEIASEESVDNTAEEAQLEEITELPSLKEAYKDYFDVGVCINPTVVGNPDMAELVVKQFSSATCENDMKPEAILDKAASMEDLENGGTHMVLNMDKAKDELDFAVSNGLKMRGHTLIWHSQTPNWIFYVDYDTNGELASRDLMLERVDNYMNDVFTWADTNYPGLFYAWDVVNEAMDDDNTMRESLWYQTIGEDYVEQVFAIARKYAPDYIKLFYNDYNAFKGLKQRAIIEMLKPVAEAGNIDGVGMQGHLNTGEDPAHFAKCAKKYADELNVVVHITEIDVPEPAVDDSNGVQARFYGGLFRELKNMKESGVPIESVSVWGLCDNLSWKANERPLLFDSTLTPKKAFDQVINAAN